jgi:N-acetylglucosaminyldiphosphoundecaprenol N-acetyl-beta-D-mannosaminyltransferase
MTTREKYLPTEGKAEKAAPRFTFLGITVSPLSIPQLNMLACEATSKHEKLVIACHNLHSLYIFHHNNDMRTFHSRLLNHVHIDGMGIVLLGRLLGHPLRRQHRVTYLDWIKPLLEEASSRNWRVFYVGMRESICTQVREVLGRLVPNLEFDAAHWDIEHVQESILKEKVLQAVNRFQPHILLVGLGMPRQEKWVLDNHDKINVNVILPCGAAMDYLAGVVPTPPRWTGKYGVEWLFRLLSEPRHLWRRYLIEPWYVLRLLLSEIIARHLGAKRESNS